MTQYTLHKLPEGFIITSDEEIGEGWEGIAYKKDVKGFIFKHSYTENTWFNDAKKVIAQQDQIDFSSLTEEEQKEIGWFDVERFAKQEVQGDNNVFLESKYNMENYGLDKFIAGFQKAQELLSDRMFTLEDIENAYQKGFEDSLNGKHLLQTHIQSLSQPKSWKVEVEMEYQDMMGVWVSKPTILEHLDRLTKGKITITKIL